MRRECDAGIRRHRVEWVTGKACDKTGVAARVRAHAPVTRIQRLRAPKLIDTLPDESFCP
jgi:hypothetical protein